MIPYHFITHITQAKRLLVCGIIGIATLASTCTISANNSQTSTATITFTIAPEERAVKVIKINGQTYLRNYENRTIIIEKHAQNGDVSTTIGHNNEYNAVKINFDKTATYNITIVNGPE